MIKLTEKQKTVLSNLNDQKVKMENEYAVVQSKINEVLEFIFDANGVDVKDIDQVGIQDDHIVYSKKVEKIEEPEVETVPDPA
jgi:hypothetical protein